jgi:arsenate reductase
MSFGYLIIVCERAEENCPITFPGFMYRLFWPFEDPVAFVGSDQQRLEKFREVRDQIDERIKLWLREVE